MFKNYLKTAYRSLVRHANYTLINISGLSVGIAVCLVIFIIIKFERSFDDFHQKKDRIYRVLSEYHHSDAANVFYGKGLPFGLPAGLKAHFTKLEKVAPFYTEGNDQLLVLDDNGQVTKKFKEETGVFVTTPSFFDIFDFPLVAGNPATALANPNCALLTKETAQKYFGDWKRAMGKTIKWNNHDLVKVTGILAPIPANTDFPLKVVLSYGTGYTANFAKATRWDGSSGNFGCFILVPPGMSVPAFNSQLREYSKQMQPADDKDSHIIQPISEVHFDTHSGNWSGKSISPELIRALWMIAAFILLIACVNFINLSTAQAVNRAREVGVRKVLGSNRTQLKLQFLTETAMIVLVAEMLAVALVLLTLPWISRLLDLRLSYTNLTGSAVAPFLVLILVAVTALAGFYPSLILAGFSPINALKSKLSARSYFGIFPAKSSGRLSIHHRTRFDHRNPDHGKTNEFFCYPSDWF